MIRQLSIALLLVSLAACGKMQEPEFRGVGAVEMGKLGLQKTELKVRLKYYNPNKFKGTLKWVKGEAWIDSSYLGPFSVNETVVADGRSEFWVPVNLDLDMKQALLFSTALLSGGNRKTDVFIRLEGQARAGRQGLYKTFPLNYKGRQSIDCLLAQSQIK